MNKNRGAATIEACIVLPLFLFFMLAMSGIYMFLMAEAHIHQSLAEASNYVAQYCYLEKRLASEQKKSSGSLVNSVVLWEQFQKDLGDDFYVERMIEKGKKGILLYVEPDASNPKVFLAKANGCAVISAPLIGEIRFPIVLEVKKKAFVGYEKDEATEPYVYITPNQSVYHMRRNCTHLLLSVQQKSSVSKTAYKPCGFCGKSGKDSDPVYVARTGDVYHYRKNCSGLKRTVTRIKQSEAGGLAPCSRCSR